MITEIGFVAGDIWNLLDQKKQLELSEVLKQTPHSKELILMALGWLCREGHVVVSQQNGRMFLQLRSKNK